MHPSNFNLVSELGLGLGFSLFFSFCSWVFSLSCSKHCWQRRQVRSLWTSMSFIFVTILKPDLDLFIDVSSRVAETWAKSRKVAANSVISTFILALQSRRKGCNLCSEWYCSFIWLMRYVWRFFSPNRLSTVHVFSCSYKHRSRSHRTRKEVFWVFYCLSKVPKNTCKPQSWRFWMLLIGWWYLKFWKIGFLDQGLFFSDWICFWILAIVCRAWRELQRT